MALIFSVPQATPKSSGIPDVEKTVGNGKSRKTDWERKIAKLPKKRNGLIKKLIEPQEQ
jgi:hypothetical protein